MDCDQYPVALVVQCDDAPVFAAEEEAELPDAHLAHLATAGQLAAAGSLSDPEGSYRGLSILTVGPDQAWDLKEADPAGKFAVVLPWTVPGGAIGFRPADLPRLVAQARS